MDAQQIPWLRLAWLLPLIVPVLWGLYRWDLQPGAALRAMVAMVVRLVLLGYGLVYIFEAEHGGIVVLVLAVMLAAASWIGLRTAPQVRWALLPRAFVVLSGVGAFTLLVVTQGVLRTSPWYRPQVLIPLGGMIFANSMNALSLALDRTVAELRRGEPYARARRWGLHAALIPILNALMSVGLVSLPGMMTGQILSGVSPLIAVRYQILVMGMIFGAAGLSVMAFLVWARPGLEVLGVAPDAAGGEP